MKSRRFSAIILASVLIGISSSHADTYELDPAHTSIGFTIRHLVISKVKGRFDKFSGTVELDAKSKPTVTAASATIETASINTAIEKRDNHLRSADFFDAEKFPHITFVGKKVAQQGDKSVVTGTLTMHGVSKEIALPFTVNGPITDPWGKSRIGIEAKTTLNRKDFGLTWNQVLETGGLAVGEEVEIEIQAEAVKQ
jgi:polyisoprenoid-binding protein YceI